MASSHLILSCESVAAKGYILDDEYQGAPVPHLSSMHARAGGLHRAPESRCQRCSTMFPGTTRCGAAPPAGLGGDCAAAAQQGEMECYRQHSGRGARGQAGTCYMICDRIHTHNQPCKGCFKSHRSQQPPVLAVHPHHTSLPIRCRSTPARVQRAATPHARASPGPGAFSE